jgi:catechol-2,3-dioxygenase
MFPELSGGIDHVHVYVANRSEAAAWYADVLGFRPVEAMKVWAESATGPLTLENAKGNVHVALFETDKPASDTIAFGASAEEFLAWMVHFQDKAVDIRLADHDLALSLYFNDPYGNVHEITTYDHELARARLP